MSTTLSKEIRGVRSMLGAPLPQFPSTKQILEELEIEYQQITNKLNDTGNAWLVNDYHLITVANQYDYRLDTNLIDFYKPLSVTVIPDGAGISYLDPINKTGVILDITTVTGEGREDWLEFTELEHMPQVFTFLKGRGGAVFGNSHSSMYIAFYRKIDSDGEGQYIQIRPVPNEVQNYKILYQVTDWWSTLFLVENNLQQKMPASSQRAYLRALVAKNLIDKGVVKWAFHNNYNMERAKLISPGLDSRISRYSEDFKEYITSLDQPDIVYNDSWADEQGLW